MVVLNNSTNANTKCMKKTNIHLSSLTSHLKSLNEKQAMTFDDENPGPGFNWTGTKICGWIRSICSTGGRYTVLPLSVLPSVQDIIRHIFLSNY
jgi:hypothetical protein